MAARRIASFRGRWRLPRRARTVLTGILGGLALTAVAGACYQAVATYGSRRRYHPPGRLVDIGGYSLHVRDAGEGSPTVVLEAGLTATSAVWAWIQPALAEVTRVISYDRPGIGWSDAGPMPHDARSNARQLAELLWRLSVDGPLVLVGHSMGGLFVRAFADLYPDRVAGMVLVDPAHPDQLQRFPAEGVKAQHDLLWRLRMAPTLAGLGIYRLIGGLKKGAIALPDEALVDVEVFFASIHHLRAVKAEMLAWDETAEQVRQARPLGDLPLMVLSATEPRSDLLRVLRILHYELARLSSRGEQRVIEGSDHYSIVTSERTARVTTAAILEVVAAARGRLGRESWVSPEKTI